MKSSLDKTKSLIEDYYISSKTDEFKRIDEPEKLRSIDVDYIQGYLVARPKPLDNLIS